MSKPMPPGRFFLAIFLLLIGALAACTQQPAQPTLPGGQVTAGPTATAGPTNTPLVLPTLYPTDTRPAAVTPTTAPTRPPAPTAASGEEVDLAAIAVNVRYTIPLLGLDRRIEATFGGTVQVVDEVTGLVAVRQNQRPTVDELETALTGLELEPVPEDCSGCVRVSYELPLQDEAGEGWLRDPVLLASIESYTAGNVGPHFPPGTTAGLRRGVSPYAPAHSLAVTASGELWRWLATDEVVPEPVAVAGFASLAEAAARLETLPLPDLAERYEAQCLITPPETLWLNPAGSEETEEETSRTIRFTCPAFSLPAVLLPLYLAMDNSLSETLAGETVKAPPSELPLQTMLLYEREDGAELLLRLNGQVTATDPAGTVYSSTLPITEVMSITAGLAETGVLETGLQFYTGRQTKNVLLVRGPLAVLDLGWGDLAPPDVRPFLEELDELLDERIGDVPDVTPAPTETPGS